jgi:RNA polymerase sigma-70 factor, ECF subfamily
VKSAAYPEKEPGKSPSAVIDARQITALLDDVHNGDAAAASRLLPIVYKQLRRLAAHYMRDERSGQTIQATELVHEAYLRLVGQERMEWQGRSHFFAMAATSMRRILVDRARRKMAQKHGAGGEKVELNEALVLSPQKSNDIVALDDALNLLEKLSLRQARVVELRFFAGLDMEEIAKIEGVSLRTVKQDWSLARAWLHRQISREK